MPKAGLDASEWERRLRLFAQGKFEFGRGYAPPPGSVWAKKKGYIMQCPMGKAKVDLFGNKVKCTCCYRPERVSDRMPLSLLSPRHIGNRTESITLYAYCLVYL